MDSIDYTFLIWFILFSGMMTLIMTLTMFAIWTMPSEDKIEIVDCYDKLNNKILGLECENLIYGLKGIHKIYITVFVFLTVIIILFIQWRNMYGAWID